jgi:integrase
MRKTLTDKGVAALKPRPKRYTEPDPQLAGHYVRVQPSGAKSYVAVARDPSGKQVWSTLGTPDMLPIDEARAMARERIRRVRDGLSAIAPAPVKPDTFGDVAANWLRRHVEANGLRTGREMKRHLDVYVLARWKDRPMVGIRRSDVAALLDQIQDEHGARQADAVLTTVRSLAHFYAARHDDYTPPFTKGMKRDTARPRSRILDDDELRALWKATEGRGRFNAITRLALLTGQRRGKIAGMKWSDVALDGTWTVPAGEREKGTGGELVLPPPARDIVRAQPRMASPFVFGDHEGKPFDNFSRETIALLARMPPMPAWVLHDLRRTARSLMARAGVSTEHAERVLGHTQKGVVGIYDRHSYREEKAQALRALAGLVDSIIHPPAANVVSIKRSKKR